MFLKLKHFVFFNYEYILSISLLDMPIIFLPKQIVIIKYGFWCFGFLL